MSLTNFNATSKINNFLKKKNDRGNNLGKFLLFFNGESKIFSKIRRIYQKQFFEFCYQKLMIQVVSSTNLQTWRKKCNYFHLFAYTEPNQIIRWLPDVNMLTSDRVLHKVVDIWNKRMPIAGILWLKPYLFQCR